MFKKAALAVSFAAATYAVSVNQAVAYPIDCAIVLCMAGGFPASAECTAAKAEVIRRITPIPIEPPLQLWNCPMAISKEVAGLIGLDLSSLSSDGMTAEVKGIRDAIQLYDITYFIRKTKDDEIVVDNTKVGSYDAQGNFSWKGSSYAGGPEWLSGVSGGRRVEIRTSNSSDKRPRRPIDSSVIKYVNGANPSAHIRAVAMLVKDYEGNPQTYFINY